MVTLWWDGLTQDAMCSQNELYSKHLLLELRRKINVSAIARQGHAYCRILIKFTTIQSACLPILTRVKEKKRAALLVLFVYVS